MPHLRPGLCRRDTNASALLGRGDRTRRNHPIPAVSARTGRAYYTESELDAVHTTALEIPTRFSSFDSGGAFLGGEGPLPATSAPSTKGTVTASPRPSKERFPSLRRALSNSPAVPGLSKALLGPRPPQSCSQGRSLPAVEVPETRLECSRPHPSHSASNMAASDGRAGVHPSEVGYVDDKTCD